MIVKKKKKSNGKNVDSNNKKIYGNSKTWSWDAVNELKTGQMENREQNIKWK